MEKCLGFKKMPRHVLDELRHDQMKTLFAGHVSLAFYFLDSGIYLLLNIPLQ